MSTAQDITVKINADVGEFIAGIQPLFDGPALKRLRETFPGGTYTLDWGREGFKVSALDRDNHGYASEWRETITAAVTDIISMVPEPE